jgi:uncharacterized phage protein (TIGR01671 family)
MRTIKFRAWNIANEIMSVPFDINTPVENIMYHSIPARDSDLEIMQYTSLKDKDGKEIYEGDIVEVDGGADEKPRMPVHFKNGCFVITWKNPQNELKYRMHDAELKYYIDMDFCSLKIIGNIYENPELLEGK